MNEVSGSSSGWQERLADWVFANCKEPADFGTMTELRTTLVNTVMAQEPEQLTALEHLLSPLAAHLSQRLAEEELPLWLSQAAEIPALAVMARLARSHITWVDPEKSLARIRHGKPCLRLLLECCGRKPEPGASVELSLDKWVQELEKKECLISTSTLSRVLKALEQAGFIQLRGATRDRHCVLLAKACDWGKRHPPRIDEKIISLSSALSETGKLGRSDDDEGEPLPDEYQVQFYRDFAAEVNQCVQ